MPPGAVARKVASEGGRKSGSRAPPGRRSLSLALSLRLCFEAVAPRGLRACCCELLSGRARRGAALPFVAPALTLSFTLLLECQTRLRPLPSAISEIERPLTTDNGSSSRMSGSFAPRASSSFDLIRSHGSFFSPAPAVHAHEMPSSMQLLAIQGESEMTFPVARVRVALRVPASAVPNHDGAAAVLSPRDGSLECVVFDRMIFHVD